MSVSSLLPAGGSSDHTALGGGGKPEYVAGDLGVQREGRRGVIQPAGVAHHRARGDGGLSTPQRPGQPLAKMFYSEILELGTTEV